VGLIVDAQRMSGRGLDFAPMLYNLARMSVAELQKTIRGLSAEDRRALGVVAMRMKHRSVAAKKGRSRFTKSKLTGQIVSKGAKGAPRVTSKQVRALLADFP